MRASMLDEIIDLINDKYSINPSITKDEIEQIKRNACKDKKCAFVRNSELVMRARQRGLQHLVSLLRKRPMRSASGIVNIAIMSLSSCPHGRCTYCPKGDYAPNSYTGFEPATMRGIQNKFDSYSQVMSRITQLEEIGHPTDKCELIIQGGTFLAQSAKYKSGFILGMYNALNNSKSTSVDRAMKINETSAHRCIGLTIETRPDWCFEPHINDMLSFGTTRVEIGVQTLRRDVLLKTRRGHTLEDVWKSTQLAKDSFLKVCYHMMPGLYSTPKEDVEMFKNLFSDDNYKPDMLKIYPLLIMKNTEMYEQWKEGKVKPYSSNEAADVIARAYKYFPYYVRVMRVQRDIPAYLIQDGVKKSNLREIVESKISSTEEIRYREVGLNIIKKNISLENLNPELCVRRYTASHGDEVFISYEDRKHNILFAFLRLRMPYKPFRKEITDRTMGVRELHVYGDMLRIGRHDDSSAQHKGFGRRLLNVAEQISKNEYDANKLLIISGVGVREYYRKMGYTLEGAYMSKRLS